MPHPPNTLNELRIVKGQSVRIKATIRDDDGRIPPLSGASFRFSVASPGQTPIIEKTSGHGITVDRAAGVATIALGTADTSGLSAGTYKYDFWMEHGDEREPIVRGSDLVVTEGVSRFGS